MTIEETEVINNAQEDFEEFINAIIKDKKYFYWTLEYFERMEYISFMHYTLTSSQKEQINEVSKDLFLDNSVVFSVKNSSIRNELSIRNITKITKAQKPVEFILEYTLFKILSSIVEELELDMNGESDEELKKTYNIQLKKWQEILKLQKSNFIFTCLKYFIEEDEPIYFEGFNKFGTFGTHKDFLFDFKDKINEALEYRISNLWLNKKFEHNMDFLFHFSDNDDKEELRFALETLGKSNAEKNKLYYRGQAYSNWLLNPSIARTKKLLSNENDLFHKILALKPNDFKNDKTDYERLITMQHYGLPTRLLDVTRNPLIALYFACSNLERKMEDGLVYIFEENKKNVFLNPDDLKVKDLTNIVKTELSNIVTSEKEYLNDNHFIRGIAKNKRIDNQSGDFIFVGIDKKDSDPKKHLKANKNVEELVSKYLILDYDVKKLILDDLEVMNIHAGSVYPELNGMTNYLLHKYKD
jgi:hypothetical protein